jgi:hypothetical protein
MNSIWILIRPELPSSTIRRIAYTLVEIGARSGLRFRLSTAPDVANGPRVAYGVPPASGTVYVHLDEACWSGGGEFHSVTGAGGRPLWCNAGTRSPDDVDLLGGVFRLLTMGDEASVPETMRDRRGIFPAAALPPARFAHAQLPLVEYLVLELVARLERTYPGLSAQAAVRCAEALSAIALTHDADCLSFAFWQEAAYNSVKIVTRPHPVFVKLVLQSLLVRNWGHKNPYHGFQHWRRFCEERDLKSCFYLFHRVRARRDLNDCRATVFTSGVEWQALRDLCDEGYEIGLHPSIHAKDSPGEFECIKQEVEEQLQRKVLGVRHHYWAIDWRAPWRTWRRHAEAGFLYDSSIAFWDIPGLRAGTCMPFRPYDLDNDRPLDLTVVPCAVADQHVVEELTGERHDNGARKLLSRIADVGGIAVLDWHTESGCNRYQYRGYVDALSDLIATGSPVATMTPGHAAALWQRRIEAYIRDTESWSAPPVRGLP